MKNPKIILIVGYSKLSYLKSLKKDPVFAHTTFICAYTRRPKTPAKLKYLGFFDTAFDLTIANEKATLKALSQEISVITCTQERDIQDYIDVMLLTNSITSAQYTHWYNLCNKHSFKEVMRNHYPELVPRSQLVTPKTPPEFPSIVKPLGFTGSSFVALIKTEAEYHKYFYDFSLTDTEDNPRNKSIQFIAEEYIAGLQYSVNVYINKGGQINFCPIIRVIPALELGSDDNFIALQYITNELTDTQMKQLRDAIGKIVALFELASTSAHFDAVYDGHTFKFFEVGIRIGGLRQEMFLETHDINHFRNDVYNKLEIPVQFPAQLKSMCIVQKASQDTGILKKIRYTRSIDHDEIPLLTEHKFRKLNILVKPVKAGGGIVARFFVSGVRSEDVIAEGSTIYNSIKIEVE